MKTKTYRIVNTVNDQFINVTCSRSEADDLVCRLNVLDPDGIYDLIGIP